MSNQHTPGPWVGEGFEPIAGLGHFYGGLILGADGHTIVAQCVMSHNEKLVAAAPELLAALEGVVRVADRATDEFDAARAAIAKATGAQS